MFENNIEKCEKIITEYREQGLKKSGTGKPHSIRAAQQFLKALKETKELTLLSNVLNACKEYYKQTKEDLEKHKNEPNEEKKQQLRGQLYIDLMEKIITEETLSLLARFRMENRTEEDHNRLKDILSEFFSPFKTLNTQLPTNTTIKELSTFFSNAKGWSEAGFKEALEKLKENLLPPTSESSKTPINLPLTNSEKSGFDYTYEKKEILMPPPPLVLLK